ncbi:MAG: flagellar hook-basal body complex protein FliE [Aestuariivirga sp.]|uniref:flagellar hook-basal body complex protein FliE n=1 Tax=Aestuariivirga sp. TaxID=2650926 RepID=UPI0025B8C02E|nr:flagellar hook-basal body complex protein FliE [Aestuariivirga sp.]MCA3561415.1 flagellar hook-basal body complex protein FliE [Aestuariivirga sp.]
MLSFNTVSSLPELGLRPAGTGLAPAPAQPAGSDFASLLGRLASDTAVSVQQGEAAALAGIQGSLPLQTVVDRVMAAERTLQAALAVRDKAVSAYQEISRMQI